MKTVGQLVREHREAKGLTLSALAEAAGTTKSYLSMIENHRLGNPPSREVLIALENALGIDNAALVRAADWTNTPAEVRDELERAKAFAEWLKANTSKKAGGGKNLDKLWRTGALRKHLGSVLGDDDAGSPRPPGVGSVPTPTRIPLINKVAAGYPTGFTDLDYPARAADEYVHGPGIDDPDAFAATVVGESMLPDFKPGDIVIFSPAAPVADGCDCFIRLEPDHECTFKRVFIDPETGAIRLQPLNPKFPPRTVDRESVAGMYRAVQRISKL